MSDSYRKLVEKCRRYNVQDDITQQIVRQLHAKDAKIAKQAAHIQALQMHIELSNREALPPVLRKLEVLHTESSSSKITINPCTGRVTLKISHNSSPYVQEKLLRLVDMVMHAEAMPAATLRGRIKYRDKSFQVTLTSESKHFHRSFIIPED